MLRSWRIPPITFASCVETERDKAHFVFTQYDVFRIKSEDEGHNPYKMLPPTDEHKWKLFCMQTARGDASVFMNLWDGLPYSDVVEMYALEATRQWRPPS